MMRSAIAFLLLTFLATRVNSDEKKPAIKLPKNGNTVVLSYDPGAGGFIRKGEPPYLKITADGQVTVTDVRTGMKKESKLTAREVEDLMDFAVNTNDFFNLTDAKLKDEVTAASAKGPAIAVGGAGTSVVSVNVNDKQHTVSFRAADAYAKAYPTLKLLSQYVAIQQRLGDQAENVPMPKDK
ncbi:MAG: hypothetical protein U0792_20540 [Gemmataceae bacterium]